ncbi:chromosomal replication initiator protein DnaA [Salinibius halmophilus]|uniref:chromosomal replication initiator protein DnaA n=1 Tax=Salinibius halmophilus TaxID=1853216 RepID=UPI000E669265|nr:chromosomal replication initiator protein DnaA [Salinibius halmophilus]
MGAVEEIWAQCFDVLESEIPATQFNTWIRRLQVDTSGDDIVLYAKNKFVSQWLQSKYLTNIQTVVRELDPDLDVQVRIAIGQPGSATSVAAKPAPKAAVEPVVERQVDRPAESPIIKKSPIKKKAPAKPAAPAKQAAKPVSKAAAKPIANSATPINTVQKRSQQSVEGSVRHQSFINPLYTFDSFVPGKSNELAYVSAQQVAQAPGGSYNPLYLYGSTGLGKTHLMHAIGNYALQQDPNARVLYVHSERFFADMVKALQQKAINEFKRFYRSLDVLMIDDVQFFAKKEKTMEEFFHTFNALLEGQQQVVLTSDRFAKDIDGLEDRLKSRFNWGLTVCIEPPELETRVAILKQKASESNLMLADDAALFIAQKVRSNVRDLEGALKAVVAKANFTARSHIDVAFIQDALKDLLASHDKQASIDNIQRVVSEYFNLGINDLLSKRRTRNIARPRQMAMALSKELTNHSLPEIGQAFGGRDHTTVLHAHRKVLQLRDENVDFANDYNHLLRILNS